MSLCVFGICLLTSLNKQRVYLHLSSLNFLTSTKGRRATWYIILCHFIFKTSGIHSCTYFTFFCFCLDFSFPKFFRSRIILLHTIPFEWIKLHVILYLIIN